MKLKKVNYVLIIVLLIMIVVLFFQFSLTGQVTDIIAYDYISKGDYVNAYAWVDENNLYLISECDMLAMSVSDEQVFSISMGLANVSGSRPVTHDLMKDIFDLFETEVIMATIEKTEDSTYYARLFLRQGNKILNLDSRPSDAVAVVVREGKPIFVKRDLMESAGRKIC
jgi:bifunctional DNase/RNase